MPEKHARSRGESSTALTDAQENIALKSMRHEHKPTVHEEEVFPDDYPDEFCRSRHSSQSDKSEKGDKKRNPILSDRELVRLSLGCSILALGLVLAMILRYLIEGIAVTQKVKDLDKSVSDLQPVDCSGLTYRQASTWNGTGGVYVVCPEGYPDGLRVYCDITSNGGGWLVFQRRMDGSLNFNRNWHEYVNGFGNPNGEFWLGLEAIHKLTQNGTFELRVDMTDWKGTTTFARYGSFTVGDVTTKYMLTVSSFLGHADAGDSLSWHNGMQFTTYDSDNDNAGDTNCASSWKGGWWYNQCLDVNLNGVWVKEGITTSQRGILWKHFSGLTHSMQFTEMKFRKINSNLDKL